MTAADGRFAPDALPAAARSSGNPLSHSGIPPFPHVRPKRGNWSFATAKAFVIRRPARERLFRLFPDSSAVEHSTVNRMVAGSNPAPGAIGHFQRTSPNIVERPDSLVKQRLRVRLVF
jgi:hypothetical protein